MHLLWNSIEICNLLLFLLKYAKTKIIHRNLLVMTNNNTISIKLL